MERDSFLYNVRRKGQIIAHKIFPDEVLSKIYFKVVLVDHELNHLKHT